jgi:hypothetical protein
MTLAGVRRAAGLCVALAVVPGVATAQSLDPTAVVDAPPVVRALVSTILVGLCGALVLARRDTLVDRAVDDTMGSPTVAVVYGLGAYVFVLFAAFYANNVVLQLGVADTPLAAVAAVVIVGGVALLAGLGYVVVGTLLTDLYGTRRPWLGLLVGSGLSAVGWLVLPLLPAFALWVLVGAFGVGGPTRTWFHGARTVQSERSA